MRKVWHVSPTVGGVKVNNSMEEHSTVVWATPTDNTALTIYVNGEMRYMKIQKPGRALGVTRTLSSLALSVLKIMES